MLSQRVKAALIFGPLFLILIYFGGWLFNIGVILILLAAGFEFYRLFDRIGYRPSLPILFTGILLIAIHRWTFGFAYGDILVTLIIFLVGLGGLLQYEFGSKDAAINLAIDFVGILVVGWVGSYLLSLRALPNGLGWILVALPIVWIADSGAYFIGKRWGKAKMTPRLSPGKTWMGFLGAVLTGTIGSILLLLLCQALKFLPAEVPIWFGAVFGLALSALTPVGDLIVSLFKRTAGVKDTGHLIPGHGGVLDRIDTWTWAALIGYYLVLIYNSF